MQTISLKEDFLVFILFFFVISLFGVLPLDTSWSASTEWRLEAEVNVLLGVQADDEWWDIDDLKLKL